ncbi:MAG: endosialidase [Lachnospiraceae bacterium]|nr:endosialidase [Lachnospiraceae bacterium]
MGVVAEVLRNESDGSVSFGDYSLSEKKKVENFKSGTDVLKAKSFREITKLEKNDMFVYESVPGTSVFHFSEDKDGISFEVNGDRDAQITLGVAEETEYSVIVDGQDTGSVKTNLSGKLSFSVELSGGENRSVRVVKK